jgi:hypothetical protein
MVTLNDAFPSKYLKAADLADGPVVATIKLAELEKLKGFDGKERSQVVLYFAKKLKPLPLNRTNFESVMDISGADDSEGFPGTKIEVFSQKVSGPNGITDGVRIRPPGAMEKPKKPAKSDDAKKPTLAEEMNDEIPDLAS